MWPGPYGEGGSRKYLLASLDESLARMGLEYVDILYSHRPTSRARDGLWFQKEFVSEDNLKRVRALNEIARRLPLCLACHLHWQISPGPRNRANPIALRNRRQDKGSLHGIHGILTTMRQDEPLELVRPAWSQSAFTCTKVFRWDQECDQESLAP
jgi:hypothetical protein